MSSLYLHEAVARSTTKEFPDTTLSKVLAFLPGLTIAGPWLAGGAIRRTLLGEEPASDFDFFFRDAQQLADFASELERRGLTKIRETEHHVHYRGSICGAERDIQLIRFRFYADAEAVVDSFDFTICQLAYDGLWLTTGQYALWDLGRKRLAVHRITYPVASLRRLLKYASQGFYACGGCLTQFVQAAAEASPANLQTHYVD